MPAAEFEPVRGTVVLTGNDFQQGFAAGPRVDLIHHGDCGYDWELSYFQIGGWNSDRTIAPTERLEVADHELSCPLPCKQIKFPAKQWHGTIRRNFIMRS